MKITPKFTFVSGSFDTDEVKMLCLPSDNHGKVDLCIKEKDCAWNIPIGGVKFTIGICMWTSKRHWKMRPT